MSFFKFVDIFLGLSHKKVLFLYFASISFAKFSPYPLEKNSTFPPNFYISFAVDLPIAIEGIFFHSFEIVLVIFTAFLDVKIK